MRPSDGDICSQRSGAHERMPGKADHVNLRVELHCAVAADGDFDASRECQAATANVRSLDRE